MSESINYISFPDVNNANNDGLLAMGGDLSLDTLVSAYSQGIFPWFNNDQPVLWWSPDPRMVLYPSKIKISRSLRKALRQQIYTVSCDQAFEQVIRCCALRGNTNSSNSDSSETWITESMHNAYFDLYRAGYAHSIEVWHGQQLVGGLYGVVLDKVFFGESMFSTKNDASKVALVHLCQWLEKLDFQVIDCQVSSEHLSSLGAQECSRNDFLTMLNEVDIQKNSLEFKQGFDNFFSLEQ